MALPDAFLNDAVAGGTANITYIALVDASGTELTGGGYARQAVSWSAATSGKQSPTADLVYSVAAGAVVGGWRGYTAASGGTNKGGGDFAAENYTGAGSFTLLKSLTAYDLN